MQARRAGTALVLNIDSRVSPTYGAQQGTAYNDHFACTRYHPLFVFNSTGDLQRCALRSARQPGASGTDPSSPHAARGATTRRNCLTQPCKVVYWHPYTGWLGVHLGSIG